MVDRAKVMADTAAAMVDIAIVDSHLSQQGQFCLLDWMLDKNFIPYADYEAWRYGRLTDLDACFIIGEEDLLRLIQQAQQTCAELKLLCEPQEFYPWDSRSEPLRISRDEHRHQQLAARWLARRDVPQLDLFMDNSAVIAENQLLDNLANRQFQNAQGELQRLTRLNARHAKLGGYQDLINYGLHCDAEPRIPVETVGPEVVGLDQEVTPLARELLGGKSRDFLAYAWRRLAENLAEVPFSASEPELHCSYAYLQIPDWQALCRCLEQEPQLYRSPILMARLAQAYLQCQQVNAFYLLWGLLFERFPDEGERLIGQQAGLLVEKWDQFLAFDAEWSAELLLGFLLIQQPGLVAVLDNLPVLQKACIHNSVNRITLDLLRARLAEEDEKPHRESLKNASPAMLSFYLNKRDWFTSINRRRF
jgi:hypothetical protein